MPALIHVTPIAPVRLSLPLSPSPYKQPIEESIDVGMYDLLDLELVILSAPSGYYTSIGITTGMQSETEDGWITGDTSFDFATIAGANSAFKRFNGGLLRYVRWIVNSSGSPTGTLTFYIRGMARQYRAF